MRERGFSCNCSISDGCLERDDRRDLRHDDCLGPSDWAEVSNPAASTGCHHSVSVQLFFLHGVVDESFMIW
jgi:hypothetical protein